MAFNTAQLGREIDPSELPAEPTGQSASPDGLGREISEDELPPEPGQKKPDATQGYSTGNTLQIYNPATLWNNKAQNFDTGIPIGQTGENILSGLGDFYEDTGQGVEQGFNHIGSKLGLVDKKDSDDLDKQIQERHYLDKKYGLADNDAASFGRGIGQASLTWPVGGEGLWAMAAKQGLANAAVGGAQAQDNWGTDNAANALEEGIGGAAGGMVGGLIGRAITPTPALSQRLLNSRQILENNGVFLNSAQQTGSKFLGTMARAGQDAPLLGESLAPVKTAQTSTKAVLGMAGMQGSELTPGALKTAKTALGQERELIYNRNPASVFGPKAGPTFGDDLNGIARGAETISGIRAGSEPTDPVAIVNHIMKSADPNTGIVPPAVLNSMRRATSNLYSQGGDIPMWGGRLAETLDSHLGLQQSVLGDAVRLQQINQQLSYLNKIAKATRNGKDPYISPTKLSNATQKMDPNDPFKQLADAMADIIPDKMGQSGTVPRLLGYSAAAGALNLGVVGANAFYNGEGWGDAGRDALRYGMYGFGAPLLARGLASSAAGKLTRWIPQTKAVATPLRILGKALPAAGGAYEGNRQGQGDLFAWKGPNDGTVDVYPPINRPNWGGQ